MMTTMSLTEQEMRLVQRFRKISQKNSGYWKTKAGKTIAIQNMTDLHLLNAMKYCETQLIREVRHGSPATPRPEYAVMAKEAKERGILDAEW